MARREMEKAVLKLVSGGDADIAFALCKSLEEAMEWNWLEEESPPPEEVSDACASALEAYNRKQTV